MYTNLDHNQDCVFLTQIEYFCTKIFESNVASRMAAQLAFLAAILGATAASNFKIRQAQI